MRQNKEKFASFIDLMTTYVLPVLKTIFGYLIDIGAKVASAIINAFGTILGAVTPIINFIIDSINMVIRGINLIKPGADIGYLNKVGQPSSNFTYNSGNPGAGQTTTTTIPSIPTPSAGNTGSTSTSSGSGSGISVAMPPIIPTNYTPFGQAGGNGSGFTGTPFGQAPTVTVNMGVVGDPEAAARAVVGIINDSYYRGTGGAGNYAGF